MPAAAVKSKKAPVKASSSKAAATQAAAAAEPVAVVAEEEDSDEEDSDDDSENGGVTQKGIDRLMKALGKDGLDEADFAALEAIRAQRGEDDEEDDDEDFEDEDDDDEEEEEADDDDDEAVALPSASKDTLAASLARSGLIPQDDDDEDEEDEEDDEEDADADASMIPVDSLTDSAYAALPDAVRSQRFHREKTNNGPALTAVRESIALDGPSGSTPMPWVEHMSLTWDQSVSSRLEEQNASASDDLAREVIFYKQALSAATTGRAKCLSANLPFTRPTDFFAEMVKTDEHMERVRQRLLDEKAGIEASEEAKRQRELKKFGKKVQVEKGLQRQREKREMQDKVASLKRKRGGAGAEGTNEGDDDDFDIRLQTALGDEEEKEKRRAAASQRGGRGGARGGRGGGKMPRSARDSKYGFGGKKRFSKSNTKESTEGGFGKYEAPSRGGRGGRGGGRGGSRGRGSSRPGKSKRQGR